MTATAEQAAQAVLLPIGTWRIDHAHSTVGFEAREMTHLVASVHGRFTDFDGTIEVTSTGAQAQGTVRVASITTDHPQRDEDLRSPHFLGAARSPAISLNPTQSSWPKTTRCASPAASRSRHRKRHRARRRGPRHRHGPQQYQRLAIAAEGHLPFGPMQVKLVLDVSAIEDGVRTGYVVFDLHDPSEIPVIAEPLFSGVNSKLTFTPVMNTDDLMKGLQQAAAGA